MLSIKSSWSSNTCSSMWKSPLGTSLVSSALLLQQCPAYHVCWTWMVLEMGVRWPYSSALWDVAFCIYPFQPPAIFCNCRQVFSLYALPASICWIHKVLWIRLLPGKNCVLSYFLLVHFLHFIYQSAPHASF